MFSLNDIVHSKNDKEILWIDTVAETNSRNKVLHATLEALEIILPIAEKAVASIATKRISEAAQLFFIEGMSGDEMRDKMGLTHPPYGYVTRARYAILDKTTADHPDRKILEKIFHPNAPLLIGIKKHIAELKDLIGEELAVGKENRSRET